MKKRMIIPVALLLLAALALPGCGPKDDGAHGGGGSPAASSAGAAVPPKADHPAPVADADFPGEIQKLPALTVKPGDTTLQVALTLPEHMKLNPLGPTEMIVRSEDEKVLAVDGAAATRFAKPAFPATVKVTVAPGETALLVDLDLYYCEKANEAKCYTRMVRLRVPLTVAADASDATLAVTYAVPEQGSLL